MLAIQRTEEGQLRLADRRRSGVAAGEPEARRTLYHWGYTDLSINKALAEMRQAEGSLPPATPWRVIRPTDRAHETAAAAPAPEEPAPEASAKKPRRKRRGTTAAAGEATGETAASPAVPRAEAPPLAAPKRSRKPARKAAATAPAEPETAAAPEPEPPAAPEERKRRSTRKAADPPVAREPEEEVKPAGTRRARSRKGPAGSPAPPEAPVADAGVDPLARARELFADGARALREIEGSTLPFARGPWTELRSQAEHILACLKGK